MQTWIEQLSDGECVELLASSTLGRLGVIVEGRPEIFPVNHSVDRATGRVVFPSNRRTKLFAALSWPWVAFEVDGESEKGGWSVLVVGSAEEIDKPDDISPMVTRSGRWAAGPDAAWVMIVPSKITGRRIQTVLDDRARACD